jgi:FAD/FMN-containing dehydrogenase|tara:strand:- start:38 stop:1120 length:1083 start_codon:yes stop_codon:yes gene_type:complete
MAEELTDFGNFERVIPEAIHRPSSIDELVERMARNNIDGIPTTLRGHGCTVRGQTLGSNIIDLKGINHIDFNEESLEITVGAGTTFDQIFTELLPEYRVPIFPNNPGQQITAGGYASAGGLGFFSPTSGGFPYYVKSLLLVTMTGEKIRCSRNENQEIFNYALGGAGRIGAIVELTLGVIHSGSHVGYAVLPYLDFDALIRDSEKALRNSNFDSVLTSKQIASNSLSRKLTGGIYSLNLIKEIESEDDSREFHQEVGKIRRGPFRMFTKDDDLNDDWAHKLKLSMRYTLASMGNLVYSHPNVYHGDNVVRPWVDLIVPMSKHKEFYKIAERIIKEEGMQNYILSLDPFGGFLKVPAFGSY